LSISGLEEFLELLGSQVGLLEDGAERATLEVSGAVIGVLLVTEKF
jgi:hypothetical protein